MQHSQGCSKKAETFAFIWASYLALEGPHPIGDGTEPNERNIGHLLRK